MANPEAFKSIIEKLQSDNETIKLTKDERTRLLNQLKHNVDYLAEKMKKSWFIKKWLYKSLYNQYDNLLEKHFKG